MSALSKVDIGNLALSNVGAKVSILNFNDKTNEARRVNQWYDVSRKQVLKAYDWSFARKRQDLAEHGDDPPDQWAVRYQYPSDCIQMRRIWNPAGETVPPVPWALETSGTTKSILTNMEDAVGIYTFDQEDTSMFTEDFSLALSWLIGFYIAFSITGKRSIAKDCWSTYSVLIASAPANDSNEQVEDLPKDADWIQGR